MYDNISQILKVHLMRYFLAVVGMMTCVWSFSAAQPVAGVPSDKYSLEKTHAYLTFSVKHAGLSDYVVSFTDFNINLDFNAQSPELSNVRAAVYLTSLNTYLPDPVKKVEWENELLNDPKFFNSGEGNAIFFNSTAVRRTGKNTGIVTGDLIFRGITKPVQLKVKYNGNGKSRRFGDRTLIGFNASGTIKRSDFGMTALLPFIGDKVDIEFSGEFVQSQ